jgi:hypothetical protein
LIIKGVHRLLSSTASADMLSAHEFGNDKIRDRISDGGSKALTCIVASEVYAADAARLVFSEVLYG